ncbi:vacuolar protein sorting-associated protein 9A-like [Cynara cardunculus var. scolymus]|uniref:Vacuolar sorting protein 9 n=1 Tax=Cynara cardunculus var. scolymus TaxID=59895 RepID=A0A103YIK2_CYNCS|nr:vacuolar protein sorting-associated protein 9A-like [Cynara cardunculus var. scolymus]XP_024994310.1 vacuolar protein sorting-associated protein 9A-like [Cynara cardunculus var. scolymus]XP_024994318.1 vacuolar protein sorting-associated protein 9A-like [Cynara cardunculus var. scolymus]KVI09732.1 Vacuolar sorting protein 9 [Cynara cardunculus var. scolymus]
MENAEPFSSSTAPLTWHDFLERMRHPSASEFVKAIKSFIVSFSNNPPDPEKDSASVQEFLANMEAAFRAHPLWAGRSEEELDSAGEGLEKYIMTKLFTRVFATHPDDVKVDDQLYEKLALVQQFIRPENLDIQPTYQNETSWLLAQKELQKINIYKAPRDKLVCILSCCKVINNLLLNASVAANENPPGADEFLPVLIYVTIKANPPQLHSNLLYIQRYRRESRLVGEAAYFFTNMLSAEAFIMNIDGKALSMDEMEFQKNMESAQTLIYGLSGDYDGGESVSEPRQVKSHENSSVAVESTTDGANSKDQQQVNKIPSISDLENKGASTLMKEERGIEEFRKFPYLYSRTGDLTVGDVEELLNSYKQLVVKYVSLAKSIQSRNEGESLGKGKVDDVRIERGSDGVFTGDSESTEVVSRVEDTVES